VKPLLRPIWLALSVAASGCVVAPDADERARRKEADGYYAFEETGSRLKRKVPMSDVNAATMAGSSAMDKSGGAGMRDRNATLPEALIGR
jgi:hypothetical protein